MTQVQIGIIGAGAAGLAAAWDFSPRRALRSPSTKRPTASAAWLPASKTEGWDWTLEKFYHHWFATDDDILALAEEMGVRDKIIFPRPKDELLAQWQSPSAARFRPPPSFCPCR